MSVRNSAFSITLLSLTFGWGLGCAALKPASRGQLNSEGDFVPGRPPAAEYGASAAYSCHAAGLIQLLLNESSEVRPPGSAPPLADGQLCAIAESLLGWEQTAGAPPESLIEFLGWHVGLASPPKVRVVTSVLTTEEPGELAVPINEVLSPFVQKGVRPHFGVATLRLAKNSTHVVLVTQDAAVELGQVPRRLLPGTSAEVKGRFVSPVTNGAVLVSDAQGKVARAAMTSEQDFVARIECGDHPGRMQVEVRGEQGGAEHALVGFPVQCGAEVPATFSVRQASQWPADPVEQAKKALEVINAERTAAGLLALQWDDAVAQVARAAAEELRDNQARGITTTADPRPALQKADAMSPVVFENPGQSSNAQEAQRQFSKSPSWRANFMNSEITHGGVGVVPSVDGTTVFVVELFIRQLPPLDLAKTHAELLKRFADKRVSAHAPVFAPDATLDAAANKYAAALAASKGTLGNAESNQFLTPLQKAYKTLNVLSGVKIDPLTFADEQGVLADKGQLIGLGLAQGVHPQFGKNSVYVVILLGTRR